MTQENSEVIRGAVDDWNRRDWERWRVAHHADMVAIPPEGWPEADPIDGLEAWL